MATVAVSPAAAPPPAPPPPAAPPPVAPPLAAPLVPDVAAPPPPPQDASRARMLRLEKIPTNRRANLSRLRGMSVSLLVCVISRRIECVERPATTPFLGRGLAFDTADDDALDEVALRSEEDQDGWKDRHQRGCHQPVVGR